AQDPATSLTLSKTSSDTSVIPVGNIALGGSGANRTVTVLAGGQTGTSLITLAVTDTGARSNSTSFAVTVLPLNTAPVISSIPVTTRTARSSPTPLSSGPTAPAPTSTNASRLAANSRSPRLKAKMSPAIWWVVLTITPTVPLCIPASKSGL